MTPLSDWEKLVEKRSANIGFMSRIGMFREPTSGEKEIALAIETKTWQESRGTLTFSMSQPYFKSRLNIESEVESFKIREINAINAYMCTPIDPEGILKGQGVNVDRYENPPSIWTKLILFITKVFRGPAAERYSYADLQQIWREYDET